MLMKRFCSYCGEELTKRELGQEACNACLDEIREIEIYEVRIGEEDEENIMYSSAMDDYMYIHDMRNHQ